MLESKNWNSQAVVQELNEAKRQEREREEQKETTIYTIMEQLPDSNYEDIKNSLIANNWDKNKVIQTFKENNVQNFAMINCSDPSESISIQVSKAPETEGMQII